MTPSLEVSKTGPRLEQGFGPHDVQKPFQPLPFCNSLMSLLIFMGKTHLFILTGK